MQRLSFKQILFLTVIVPLVFIFFLELLTRLFFSASEKQNITLEMPTWMIRETNSRYRVATTKVIPEWLFQFEEGQGFRVRLKKNLNTVFLNSFSLLPKKFSSYTVKSNALGFRSKEPINNPDLRILVFGDSSSFGWGVEQEHRYGEVLVNALNKKFPDKKIELLNFAIPGDSSEYGKLVVATFSKIFPADIVIFGFGANDAKLVYRDHVSEVATFKQGKALYRLSELLRTSLLVRKFESLIKQNISSNKKPVKQIAVNEERYQDNLIKMVNKVKKSNLAKATVIITLCTPNHYVKLAKRSARISNSIFVNGQGILRKTLKKIKEKNYFSPELSSMQKKYGNLLSRNPVLNITSDGCHPNQLGHRLVGEKLAEKILTQVTLFK
jgi:lysophospholipase L1-like esterase